MKLDLKGAYFIKCNDFIKDENGNVIEIHCTYDQKLRVVQDLLEERLKVQYTG